MGPWSMSGEYDDIDVKLVQESHERHGSLLAITVCAKNKKFILFFPQGVCK